MNADQVSMLRDFHLKDDGTGQPMAGSLAAVFNNELAFVNSKDYVVYDDANELVHCIKPNTEGPIEQARWPFRFMTGFYGNLQYMEAFYDMANFEKAVKGLLTDKGLITKDQEAQILKWATGIQNQTIVPKQPGPYFRETVLPVGQAPTPEVRADGLFHASPIGHYTNRNKLEALCIPVIEGTTALNLKKQNKIRWMAKLTDTKSEPICTAFTSIMEGIKAAVGDDLYYVSITDDVYAATYSKDKKLASDVPKMLGYIFGDMRVNENRHVKIYVEAYGVCCQFDIYVNTNASNGTSTGGGDVVNPTETAAQFTKRIRTLFNDFIDNFDSSVGAKTVRSGLTVTVTTSTAEIGDDLDRIAAFLYSIDCKKITVKLGTKSVVINPDDPSTIQKFKEGVLQAMPNENGSVATGNATVNGNGSVTYTLRVRYYNEAECEAKIGDKYYNTANEALAVGGTVVLMNDVTDDLVVPKGVNATLDLNGHNVVNKVGHTITNHGILTIIGEGVVDNVTHKHACLFNDEDGTIASLAGGCFYRSKENSIIKDNDPEANSYYIFLNKGRVMRIEDGVTLLGQSTASSAICVLGSATKKARIEEITGGRFQNKFITMKIDEYGEVGKISGGEFVVEGNTDTCNLLVYGNVGEITGANISGGTKGLCVSTWKNNDGDEFVPTVNVGNGASIRPSASGIGLRMTRNGTAKGATLNVTGGYINGAISVAEDSDSTLVITGGSFQVDPSPYCLRGYTGVLGDDNRYMIGLADKDPTDEINAIFDNLSSDTLVVEAEGDRTYTIVTSEHTLGSLFDEIVNVEYFSAVEVNNTEDAETPALRYEVGGDLESFKAQVDALLPKANTDPEVTLRMVVYVD